MVPLAIYVIEESSEFASRRGYNERNQHILQQSRAICALSRAPAREIRYKARIDKRPWLGEEASSDPSQHRVDDIIIPRYKVNARSSREIRNTRSSLSTLSRAINNVHQTESSRARMMEYIYTAETALIQLFGTHATDSLKFRSPRRVGKHFSPAYIYVPSQAR